MKLRAGSLTYAMVFILIVSLICFSFYSLFFYSNQSVDAYIDLYKTQLNARSGINLLLSRQNVIKSGEKKTIDLYDNKTDSVELEKNYWGALEIVSSTALDKEYRYTLTALVGNQSLSDTSFALYLADQSNALVVAGKTELTGDCYLPQGTIKTGYINGQPFNGIKPVNGTIKKSPSATLAYNEDLYKYLQQQFETDSLSKDSIISLSKQQLPDTVKNPFSSTTITLYSAGVIVLNRTTLSGRIKVFSGKKIIVKADVNLQDVVLFAPIIEFENEWKGCVQAFAHDTLMIGKKCEFSYPSVLGIIRTKNSADNPLLKIMEEVKINGDVFALDEKKDFTKHISIQTDEKTFIKGRIYSSDIVDFKGTLYGSIACTRIIYANSSAVYENHLFNVEVNSNKLPAWYVGSAVIKQKSKNGIIKWL